jgi:hypothetical protein
VGVSGETMQAQDVKGLGLLTSYTRLAPFVGATLRAGVPLGGTGGFLITLSAQAVPTSYWAESPKNATGTDPHDGPDFAGALAAEYHGFGRWWGGAQIGYDERRITFSGVPKAPLAGTPSQAVIQETLLSATVRIGRSF